MKKAFLLLILAGCDPGCVGPPLPPPPTVLPMQELAAFEYKERAKLPESVTRWNEKLVRATGYVNPPSGNGRGLTKFLLVKDQGSCCFGKNPQLNHYVEVKLKPGQTVDYSTNPVSVQGKIRVEERFDGDWPVGLYWMENAELVK